MKSFRTPREMNEISEHQTEGQPYVLEYPAEGQLMIFFGAVHSNDPAQAQWPVLETKWQEFLTHQNDRKLVLYEGRFPRSIGSLPEDEALRKYSESGLILHKAHSAGLTVESPEPDRVDELHEMDLLFDQSQIMTYYFARQMLQWHDRDHKNQPEWEEYAKDYLAQFDSVHYWEDDGEDAEEVAINLKNAKKWYKQQTGKAFDPEDSETLYQLSDPYQSKVSAACGEYRDDFLYQRIKKAWRDGDDLFVVFGGGHAIRLEPALAELAGGIIKGQEE